MLKHDYPSEKTSLSITCFSITLMRVVRIELGFVQT